MEIKVRFSDIEDALLAAGPSEPMDTRESIRVDRLLQQARKNAVNKSGDKWKVPTPTGWEARRSWVYDQEHVGGILDEAIFLLETTKRDGYVKSLRENGYTKKHFKIAEEIIFDLIK